MKNNTTPAPANGNKNESVSVVMNAVINSREMCNHISALAAKIASGEADSLPEEFADLFTVNLYVRPSGSKYVVVDFAD